MFLKPRHRRLGLIPAVLFGSLLALSFAASPQSSYEVAEGLITGVEILEDPSEGRVHVTLWLQGHGNKHFVHSSRFPMTLQPLMVAFEHKLTVRLQVQAERESLWKKTRTGETRHIYSYAVFR